MSRLVVAIQRALGTAPGVPPASITAAAADADRADSGLDRIRELIRNPSLVMDYDDYLMELRAPVRDRLADRELFPLHLPPEINSLDADLARAWVRRVRDYDDLMAPVLAPLKLIGMYGTRAHEPELTQTLLVLGQESTQREGVELLTSLHQYPAILATYAAALGALAKENYSMLRAAVADVFVLNPYGGRLPFIVTSGSQSITGIGKWLALGTILSLEDEGNDLSEDQIVHIIGKQGGRRLTPISDHLYTVLAPLFQQQFASDNQYADAFDRVEVLLDAISEDGRKQSELFFGGHGGYGRYTWRHRHSDHPPEAVMLDDVRAHGAGWTPLLGGLFDGSEERAVAALEAVKELAGQVRSRHW